MTEEEKDTQEIEMIKELINDKRLDDAVEIIALYLGDSTEENYIKRLEDIIEMLLSLHGGKTVIRFLIENLIIDIPSLLENISKKDSLLRYGFLLILKPICENECDLLLPYSEALLNSEDPNVREADLQLLIFIAGGDTPIEKESLVKTIALKLNDDKDFVKEKAIQALKTIGKKKPLLVTKILTNYIKTIPENENIKNAVDNVLKSIVSIEKIEEIVDVEEIKEEIPPEEIELKEKDLEKKVIPEKEGKLKIKEEVEIETREKAPKDIVLKKKEEEILDKVRELTKKEIKLNKKEIELKEKEKELDKKEIQAIESKLKEKETEIETKDKVIEVIKKKVLNKEEKKIFDKELELTKKDIELKKKKLELKKKKKELEERELIEREKTLKLKEKLIEEEKKLTQVEIELKKKTIEKKKKELIEQEIKRAEDMIDKIEQKNDD
ncbi:MAG: hypothetical protein ACTSRI_19645 [Promethearchaeota archaeon]